MELTVNDLRRYGRCKTKSKYVILVYYNNIVKYIAKRSLGWERTVILKDALFFDFLDFAKEYVADYKLEERYDKVEIKRVSRITEYRLEDN